MLRSKTFAVTGVLARNPRIVVALMLLLVLGTQGAVAESGDMLVSPMEEGNADYGPTGD
jgi:hypothetical protein